MTGSRRWRFVFLHLSAGVRVDLLSSHFSSLDLTSGKNGASEPTLIKSFYARKISLTRVDDMMHGTNWNLP